MKTKKIICGDEENGTTLKKGKVVQVWLTKEIKLSQNYNSGAVSFGMKSTVEGDLNSVKKRLQKLVDEELMGQVKDLTDFLNAAGK